MKLFFWMAALVCLSAQEPEYTFGTTAVSTSALQGKVYLIPQKTEFLPKFEKLKSVGSIYTHSLNIWPRNFREGFPGVTDRLEWFAIDYTGKFWVEAEGVFRFGLMSDDGSRLWIDGKLVVDLDGQHPAVSTTGSARLSRGIHQIRVSYYQGPAFAVALVLSVAPPGKGFRIFNTDEFLPPKDPAEWLEGKISEVEMLGNPYAGRDR